MHAGLHPSIHLESDRNRFGNPLDSNKIRKALKARCTACEAVSPWREDVGLHDRCSACGRTGALRPHVVWFGEVPFQISEIYAALNEADLFVAIGTSSSVYPAAGFVSEARALGIRTCEINLEPSDNAEQAVWTRE